MKSVDTGVLARSVCFSFTPSDTARQLYFYPTWCGHYFCTGRYFMRREYFPPLLVAYIREGTLHVEYEGETFDAKKGDVVLLDCARPHYYQAMEGLEFVYIHFDGSNSHEICGHILKLFGPLIRNQNNALVGNLIYNMVKFYEQDGVENMFDSSMRIYKLLQLLSERELHNQKEDTSVEKTIRYIRSHVGDKITLEELADIANLSTYYFSHRFKEETGLSPIDYVINTRLDQAKILLARTSMTVEEIAYEVGYQSSNSLINLFNQKLGFSPREYRKLAK